MSQPIKVNDSLFLAIESFYSNQQLALSGIENYLQQNCALGDAFGLLLGGLKPQYDEGREKATSVVRAIEKSIGALRSNVVDYQHDVEEQEKAVQAQTDALRKQADDIAAAAAAAAAATATASSVSSGGGYRTPGGGGGGDGRATFSGPSGSVTPPATAVAPSASVVPVAPLAPVTPAASGVTTTINAGEGSTVTVIDGNGNVVAHHNAGTPDPTPTPIPTPTTAAPGTSTHAGPATPDPTSIAPPVTASATPLDPAALAAQNAHHAALYDQLWKDQAAVDPLGRSASELRLAWEARESVALDPASVGGTAIGFGAAADPLVTIPVNFSPMAFDPVTPAIVQPPILAGAFA